MSTITTHLRPRKATIVYSVAEVAMRSIFNNIKNNGDLEYTTVMHSVRMSKTKHGTIRIKQNRGSTCAMYTGITEIPALFSRVPKEVLDAVNSVLDAWSFDQAPSDYPYYGTSDSKETFHTHYKEGCGEYAEKTTLRVLRAQMPVFSVMAEKRLVDYPDTSLLTDYFYIDGETVLSQDSPYRYASDIKTFAYEAFGFYRKDLIKSIVKSNVLAIEWVSWWKEFLTEDEIIATLQHFIETPPDLMTFECLNKNLILTIGEQVNKKSVKRLAKGYGLMDDEIGIGLHIHEATNSLTLRSLPDQKFSDWRALHRALQKAFLDTFGEDRIELPEDFEEINTERVRVLTSPEDYAYTGEVLHNCVGYGTSFEQSLAGHAYHIRFDGEDGPEALMEIQPDQGSYTIGQFFGPRNATLSEEAKADYLSWITPNFSLLDRKALMAA